MGWVYSKVKWVVSQSARDGESGAEGEFVEQKAGAEGDGE